jgi:predicted transglutaminase-like cysteine proteinase
MGKATITNDLGQGEYEISYHFHGQDRINARIAELETRISDIQDQIDALDPDDPKVGPLELQKTALEKMVLWYQSNMPDDLSLTVWCADLSEGLSDVVGTIEINGESPLDTNILIRPGFSDQAVYDQIRDGQIQPIVASGTGTSFLNLAIFPGWQRWMPTYRVGQIVADSINFSLHTCSICLQSAFSTQLNIDINKGADWGECNVNNLSGWTQFCSDNPAHPLCTNDVENDPMHITAEKWAELGSIQELVNTSHDYENDASGKEIGDDWRVMGEGEAGDCEDFALTKINELIDAGWPVGNLQMATCYTETGGYHAVVLIRTSNMGNLILDNRYENIMFQNNLDYRWHMYQRAGSSWGLYSVILEDVTIEYMNCHSAAFADGDLVIVEFTDQDWTKPKVIGFFEDPQGCGADFYNFACGWAAPCSLYERDKEAWSIISALNPGSESIQMASSVKILLDIYIIGGNNFTESQSPAHSQHLKYSTQIGNFTSVLSMLDEKCLCGAFSISLNHFITGGLRKYTTGYGPIDDFEKYISTSDSWSALANLSSGRWGHCACSIMGYGYIFHGRNNVIGDSLSWINSTLQFNPSTESWSGKTSTPYGRSYAFAMEILSKVYVTGGLTSESVTENDIQVNQEHGQTDAWVTFASLQYDPVTNAWSGVAQFSGPFGTTYGKAGSGANGIGYQQGTLAPTGYFSDYNPLTDTWRTLDSNPYLGGDPSFFTGIAI